jgi:gentisate 1,2-dioxygenase
LDIHDVSSNRAAGAAALEQTPLIEAMAAANSQPLWLRFKGLVTPEPRPPDSPMIWPWSTMSGLVERAVQEVRMEDAERRALLLSHPAFGGAVDTTTTLAGALQILEPGESAPPHRHTLSAIRLVMMGEGAVTITDGKPCPMQPGDLILTPSWTWHEHHHEGKIRTVWFDGLDYPLVRNLATVFFEVGPGPMPKGGLDRVADEGLSESGVLPADEANNRPHSPLFRYAWSRVSKVLDTIPEKADGSRRVRYTNPTDGGPVLPTLDCYALRLSQDRTTTRFRTTSNAVAVVIEGEGESQIGGTHLDWRQHDVFTIPRWNWIQHTARHGSATIFLMTDRELISRMGYLREETGESGDTSAS